MAIVQKPFNQSNFVAKSGPPAWKELPTWYQISDADHMIPPNVQRTFAQQMNARYSSILMLAMHRMHRIQMKLLTSSLMQQKENNDNVKGLG